MERRATHLCPICFRPLRAGPDEIRDESRPFCSPGCRLIDLGRWLDGVYRIPRAPDEREVLDGEAEDSSHGRVT
jgi:endogenous inhibitor of DNA gyrase (YacG/DUF329 family)